MKKYINISFIYAIAAIVCGVFYREYTKIMGFTGRTTLAFTHLHLFALGVLMFLVVALFAIVTDVEQKKQFRLFMILYNIGLPFMVIMLFVRGILQVQNIALSAGLNASVSGISGISHIIMTIAIVLLFVCLRNSDSKLELKDIRKGGQ